MSSKFGVGGEVTKAKSEAVGGEMNNHGNSGGNLGAGSNLEAGEGPSEQKHSIYLVDW